MAVTVVMAISSFALWARSGWSPQYTYRKVQAAKAVPTTRGDSRQRESATQDSHSHDVCSDSAHSRIQRRSLQLDRRKGMGHATRAAFAGESSIGERPSEIPALKQMHPGSPFLQDINRPGAMPPKVGYFNIVGDIRVGVRIRARGRNVVGGEKSFGDFWVSVESAGSIPNASSQCQALTYEHCLDVTLGRRTSRLIQLDHEGTRQIPIHRHLRSWPAARSKMLEILRQTHIDPGHQQNPVPAPEEWPD